MTSMTDKPQLSRTVRVEKLGDDSGEEEFVLEPTIIGGTDTVPSQTEATVDRTLSAGDSRELVGLLRNRLRAAALFLAIAYLAFYLFALATPGSGYDLLGPSFALRGLLAAAVFGLLSSAVMLTYRQLRWLEVLFFGLSMLLLLVSNYNNHVRLFEQQDLVSRVAIAKNGIMRVWIYMMIYGVFIPNHPKRAARVILSMALSVLVMGVMIRIRHLEGTDPVVAKTIALNFASNVLFLLCGAALAIYSAAVLNGLRAQLHEARQLGHYRLIRKLDAGGMGEVYLAEHQLLKRPCAIKLINPDLEKNSIAIARFEREVHAASTLSHPNTIEIYDYGISDDGTFYFVMEFLPGLSLADLVIQSGPIAPERCIYLMRQVCGSLGEAHRLGMVHRDLKPANIFVAILGGQCDIAKVLDFGIVKQAHPSDGKQLTADFTVSGTPTYMSPEQAKGNNDVDGRSDIYALGAVMYFALSGRPPFEHQNPMEMMIAHASEKPVPIQEIAPEVPADLAAIVMRCLAKSSADRYEDTAALYEALGACGCANDWDQTHAEQWWAAQAIALEANTIEADVAPAASAV